MVKQEVYVKNPAGLHARPAGLFVKTAAKYPCRVSVVKNGRSFNGKSIVNVMSACVKCGNLIELCCDGEQEKEALDELVQAVESGLGEL